MLGLTVPALPLGTGIASAASASAIHYKTDSGFEVIDASGSAPPKNGNPFPDADTLELPDITLSASGSATVTVDQRTGTFTKLSAISASPDVTVDPTDKQAVILKSGLHSLDFASVDYDASNAGTDLSYDAGSTASLTIKSTGLSQGTTVEAIDTATDSPLDSATVDASGVVTFTSLPSGTHDVNLEAPSTRSSGGGRTGSDTIAPTADAGPDRTITVGEQVTLDASNSTDDRALGTIQWDTNDDGSFERTGRTVTLSFDSPGEYDVGLRVWDPCSNSDTDTVRVSVSAPTTVTAATTTETTPATTATPSTTTEPTPPKQPIVVPTTERSPTATSVSDPSTPTESRTTQTGTTREQTEVPTTPSQSNSTAGSAGTAGAQETAADGPGFGIGIALVSVLALAFVVGRRDSEG
ncbi:MAG: PKD domain-containing protein [Halorientalis sp.]